MSYCQTDRHYSHEEFLKAYAVGGSHAKAVGEAAASVVSIMRRADLFNQRNIGSNLLEAVAEYLERVEKLPRHQVSMMMNTLRTSLNNAIW